MTSTRKKKNELAQLKARVAELERAAKTPEPEPFKPDPNWIDQMHQMREGRMSQAYAWSRDELAAFEAACPTDVAKGIALRDARAPTGRPGMIPVSPGSQQPTSVRPEGSRSGWVAPAPLSNPPGVAQADRLMAAEDREFRRQRIREGAEVAAFDKIAAEKK